MEKNSKPFIIIGQYFKDKNGERHVVEKFKGTIIDESGKKHKLEECEGIFWTKKEIKEIEKKAKKFRELLK